MNNSQTYPQLPNQTNLHLKRCYTMNYAQLLLSVLHLQASIRSVLESMRLRLLIPLAFSKGPISGTRGC
jgi:hypothetical protein